MDTNERIEDGGPAFPGMSRDDMRGYGGDVTFTPEGGMTLRDWFAGQALTGLLANNETPGLPEGAFAILSYQMADAMLAARKKGGA